MIADASLRAAYGRALAEREGRRADCPAPDAIAALVEQRGDETARLRMLDHVMACDRCRKEFELLRALREGERQSRRHFSPAWGALAAAIVITIGGTLVWRAPWRDTPDVIRGGGDSAPLIAPRGDVDLPAARAYTWHATAGATTYILDVTDTSGAVRVHLVTSDTTATTPASLSFVVGGAYVWTVTATRTDGSQTRVAPARFVIRSR